MSISEWLEKGSYLLAIGGSGILIAAVILSQVIYEAPKEKQKEDEETHITPVVEEEYDKKYLEELKSMEHREMLDSELKVLKTKVLDEDTPLGVIKLYYDHEYKGFIWYCDRNHVPYRFLETVVRKYIIEYDCCNLYVDLHDELDKSSKLSNRAEEKLSTQHPNTIFVETKDKRAQLLKILAIKNNYLKFKYGGKIEEYKPLVESSTFNIINIDFSTYKQLKEKSN
jgi:hypothetical protein